MKTRIFVLENGGIGRPTNLAGENGIIYVVPLRSNEVAVPINKILSSTPVIGLNCVLNQDGKTYSMQSEKTQMQLMNPEANTPGKSNIIAETPDNLANNKMARVMTPVNETSRVIVWDLTVDATLAAGDATFALIGDSFNIIGTALSWNISAGTVIGGTFGTNTITAIKAMLVGSPALITRIVVTAQNAGTFQATKFMQVFSTDPMANITFGSPVPFSLEKSPMDFSQLIKNTGREFKAMVNQFTAIAGIIPKGEVIKFSFEVGAFQDSALMNQGTSWNL